MVQTGLIRYEYGGFQTNKGGIELISTDANKQKESSEKLQGYKRDHVILIGDEWDTLPPMLLKTAKSNLTGNKHMKCVGAFNPTSRFSNGGLLSKPKAGWESIDENTMEWETDLGIAIRFDATVSQNVVERKAIWKGLITWEQVEEDKERMGEDSPEYWTMLRGFFPPTGDATTLFSEAELISQYKAHQKVITEFSGWESQPDMIAGLDPCLYPWGRQGSAGDFQVRDGAVHPLWRAQDPQGL